MFVNVALLFSAIGFATYLFILIAGFFGCCTGITEFLYDKIVLIIVICSAVLWILCSYHNCCKLREKQKNKNVA